MMKMNDTIYYKNLYTLAKTKKDMVCEHCGKEIILCDKWKGSGYNVIIKCLEKGFVHKDRGHFHHCDTNKVLESDGSSEKDLGEVAFPVLTDDEKRRLEHSKGVKNE
jgi:uncharacterized Zn finger protein